MTQEIGPHRVGSTPRPLELVVTDHDGEIVNLVESTVYCRWTIAGESGGLAADVVDASAGLIRVTWTAEVFAAPGLLRAVIYWTQAGATEVADEVVCLVEQPPVALEVSP
jgi:hypothetical protein